MFKNSNVNLATLLSGHLEERVRGRGCTVGCACGSGVACGRTVARGVGVATTLGWARFCAADACGVLLGAGVLLARGMGVAVGATCATAPPPNSAFISGAVALMRPHPPTVATTDAAVSATFSVAAP